MSTVSNGNIPVVPAVSEAEKARMERDKLRQREQERRRREAQVSKYFQPPSNFFISNSEYFFYTSLRNDHNFNVYFIFSAKPNRHEQTI